LSAGLITLYATETITGVVGVLLLILASTFIVTSFTGVCPLYLPFGWSTLRRKITDRRGFSERHTL
jgi:hypothetical protein